MPVKHIFPMLLLPLVAGSDRLAWRNWFRGMVAGFIGGGAGAFSGGLSALVAAPDQFNFGHPAVLLRTMAGMFLVTGILHMMAYLSQYPVPAVVTTTTTETVTNPVRVPGSPGIKITETVETIEKS